MEQPDHHDAEGPQAPSRSFWARAGTAFVWALRVVTVALLSALVLTISWQVATRYLPGLSVPRWTEEVSLIFMVWLSLLGSALAVRRAEHLAMDLVARQLPPSLQRWLYRLVWLVVAGFSLYLIWYGTELATRTMGQTFSATKLPIGLMYYALPAGGAVMALYAITNIFRRPEVNVAEVVESAPPQNRLLQAGAVVIGLAVIGGAIAILGVDTVLGPIGVLLGTFALALVMGIPIAFGLGIAALAAILVLGPPPLIVAQRMASGVNSTPLLAIPFFILAGQLMSEGGIAQRLVDFARVMVGPIRGGLAMVNVVASMLFGGASGSSVGDVSANGSILIPMMKRKGYDTDFSVAITVTSSTQGLIIPPSHNAVIYSLAAGGVSIGALFLGGYLPGILIGLSLMAASYAIALRRDYPREPRPPVLESIKISLQAIPGLSVGFIIVGGIAFGFFTATEAAAIGTVVALLVGAFVHRELSFAKLGKALLQAVRTISIVVFLIATASAFAWLMAYLRIPGTMASGLLGLTENRILLLLSINLMLLVLGAIMDMAPLILILTPVLLPIVTGPIIGMSEVHFGIVMMMNLGLGLTTPPVGTALFVGCAIGGIRIEEASRAMIWLWPAMLFALLMVTFFPWFVEFLPGVVARLTAG
ncbi:MAG: TRAP transporter large permease subunit [Trueperaceae bacterium]|nr:TRAP transporter large permease subunit [Trueperaceae bacterium]